MEALLSDDSSCDSVMKNMKDQLNDFGLGEENLSKEEMSNLLKALNDSKSTVKDDEVIHQKTKEVKSPDSCPPKPMKRRYLAVRDRRLPWSLLPTDITPAQRARSLAVYIKFMAINRYHQARQSIKFAAWPPSIQIIEESTTRIQPCRSTRSGRNVPMYTDFDDDSSDLDFVVAKTKRRKVSGTEVDVREGGGMYSNKVLSLKRKHSRDDIERVGLDKCEASTSDNRKGRQSPERCMVNKQNDDNTLPCQASFSNNRDFQWLCTTAV